MLAYTLKEVLQLVPDAYGHVKQASITEDFPLDSASSTIASALQVQYHQHVSGKPVDLYAMEKIASAVEMYGVGDVVDDLTGQMKAAAFERAIAQHTDPKAEFLTKQAGFVGDLSGFKDVTIISATAQELYKEAKELGIKPSEEVVRYSGHAFLNKQAAVESLAARYQASGNVGFAKIAVALGKSNTDVFKPETVQDVCRTVSEMDKSAGLSLKGFDFYREVLLTKEAAIVSALKVKLAGKEIPYESIERVGKARIGQYIGEDVAKEMDSGAANFKQVVETLPLDLQRVMLDLTKNV